MQNAVSKSVLAGLLLGWAVAGVGYADAAQPWIGGRMDTGLYLGAGGGLSKSEIDSSGFSGSLDDKDTGWKVFAGYQFNQYIAIEGGYYDLGKVTFNGVLTTGPVTSGSFKSKAYALSAVGSLPVGDSFALLARLGLARGDQKGTVIVGGVGASASDDSTEFTYGLGLRYDLTRNMALRAQWERFRVGGTNVGGKNDVDLYSLDFVYRFGN